ncbi:uncharacterized protein PAE49_001062 isoform 2-T2 [Odontesthes bonariensis]
MPRRRSLQPDDPRGPSLVPPVPAASTSELEQTQDSRDLMLPADVQQLLVIKEEVPWIPSLDQQDPVTVCIKEEEEELWTGQEGEQLDEQETDISRFSLTVVTVKSEDDEEKPQSSQLLQVKTEDIRETEPPTSSSAELMKTEADGEDCGGPELAMKPYPNDHLQPNTDEKDSDSFETEVSDDDYWEKSSDTLPETEDSYKNWKRTIVPESGVNLNGGCNTSKKSYRCSECGKQFLYKLSFKKHSRVHTEEKAFGCNECGKRFNKKSHLQSHMRVHTGEKPFACGNCGKRFSERGTLSKHMRVHTGERPFVCNDCGKRFRERGALSRHVRVHTGEKPFACRDCGKRFRDQGTHSKHMKVHTGEKPFACNDCDKRFSERGTLSKHMRVHTGEKPFACNNCGKRFSERGTLKLHTRVHTGEKPFACTDCWRRFSRNSHLKTHIRRIHTGEKPFGCSDCDKRFSERGNLTKHMRVHTRETS